jgi:outer membrane biosynthesis protein TonB
MPFRLGKGPSLRGVEDVFHLRPNSEVHVPLAPSSGESLMEATRTVAGEPASDSAFAVDDPEMAELRALAAEVVSAGAGTPRRSGYRPRLEANRRMLAVAPVELLFDLRRSLVSSVRGRPGRTRAFALGGIGAVAGALILVWTVAPGDEPLELTAASPPPVVAPAVPAPPPAQPEPTRDQPAPAPIAAVAVPAVETASPAPRVARSTTEKRSLGPTVKPERSAQRRGGRRIETKVAMASRRKEGKDFPAAARASSKTAHALDRVAIIQGIQAIQPRVKECYRRYRQQGVANASIQVGPDGKVTKVSVAGPLARTRTAACVKAAVKTARFRGGGMTFQYPLVLP